MILQMSTHIALIIRLSIPLINAQCTIYLVKINQITTHRVLYLILVVFTQLGLRDNDLDYILITIEERKSILFTSNQI